MDLPNAAQLTPEGMKVLPIRKSATHDSVRGKVITCREERTEVDGSPMVQRGIGVALRMLYIRKGQIDPILETLTKTDTPYETALFVTPYDEYVGFRAFGLLEEYPNASFVRLRKSPDDHSMGIEQYYSRDFIDLLQENYDTAGLRIKEVDIPL